MSAQELDVLAQAAPSAAGEVAAATEITGAAGGMGLEMAAQTAEVVREVVSPEATGEDIVDAEERRTISRSVFRLAWPAIAENALQTLMGLVDTAVVARIGTDALSGVGASQQVIFVLTTALIAVSMGTTVLIARFIGAGQRQRANAVLKQSIMMSLVLGLVLMPVGLVAHPIFSIFGLNVPSTTDAATYLSITMYSALFIVFMFVAGAALRGSGDTRTPMMVTGFINVINAVLAVELVFGGNRASSVLSGWINGLFGTHITVAGLSWIPELGVAGSAWATAISRGIGAFVLLGVLLMPSHKLNIWRGGNWRPSFNLIGRTLRIGVPSMIEQMVMSLGILAYSFIVIGMGETIFATSRLVTNGVFLSQMPGFGFSVAATTLVGQSLGAKRPQRALLGSQLATRSALLWMSAMGVVFFFFGDYILRIFTDDPQLLQLGSSSMKVIAFTQPFLAMAFVYAGSLRGAGDVKYPMWVTTSAVWLVRLPVAAFIGLNTLTIPFTNITFPGLNFGLPGVYAGLVVEAAVRAFLLWLRYRAGKWQAMKV